MPQMAPSSWMMILSTSILMMLMIKTNIFFEKKC